MARRTSTLSVRFRPLVRGLSAAFAAVAAGLFAAPEARAEGEAPIGEAPIGKAQMTEDMHAYFHGEKWEGPVFFGAGLASAGIGAALITRDDALARGAAYPVFGIGLIQLIVGAVVFLRTDAQVARLDKELATNPAKFKKDESARIKSVNTEFIALAVVESAFVVGGVAMAAIAAQDGCCRTLQGVGLGLAGQGGAMLMLDAFAAARARDYTDSLRRFDAVGAPGARAATPSLGIGPISVGFQF
jgi:hypothetical protein